MRRHEIKFDISEYKLIDIVKDYKLKELHPKRKIQSIYFDTIDYDFFTDSEEGQTPRKKVRLRSYNEEQTYSLEIKYANSYYREKIVLSNFLYTKENFLKKMKELNINELIHPKLTVTYERYYYFSPIGRITIDKNIYFQKINNFFKANSGIVKDNKTILEVKIQKEKFDKHEVLKCFNFKESRNSKYCNGVSYPKRGIILLVNAKFCFLRSPMHK